jgi:hypothetical protein
MRPSFSFASLILASFVLLPGFVPASAHASGKCLRKPICPPYCMPGFGYYPTQWRAWPEAVPEPVAKVEELPPPPPELEKAPPPKEVPAKDKKPAKTPEPKPAPKPTSRVLPPVSPYAPSQPAQTGSPTSAAEQLP